MRPSPYRPPLLSLSVLALIAGLGWLAPSTRAANPYALSFDGVNDYVSFGPTANLGVSTFTVECWFKRLGAGVPTSTGQDGVDAVPLVTKGRAEFDGDNRDMNYFLGIRGTDNVLVADFEEGATGVTPGRNHPVVGRTTLQLDTWYHAAVTYDGVNLSLYLNGILETRLSVGQPPRWNSIQYAGVGTALDSAGASAGYFNGVIDEVRIWNYALGACELSQNVRSEIEKSLGLIGRWGFNEGSGPIAADSAWMDNGTLNGPVWVAGGPAGNPPAAVTSRALSLTGSQHVGFGAQSGVGGLGAATFTVECWFKRTGTGTTASTGSGGVTAIPLVTKGRGEADGDNRDMNYFLGIRASDNVLVADFEEGASGANPGLNHPVAGVTPIANNRWYHAAATYDGTNFVLYLNGRHEATLVVGQPPRSDSIQHAALGTAMNSTGVAQGHFVGLLDEVRIWGVARTEADIWSDKHRSLDVAEDLCCKLGLDETGGTNVTCCANRIKGAISGTGATFVLSDITSASGQADYPADGATGIPRTVNLRATITSGGVRATFYGRPLYPHARPVNPTLPGPDFTLVMMPDTQRYVDQDGNNLNAEPAMFQWQTKWAWQQRYLSAADPRSNIVYVAHMGDCVEHSGNNYGDAEYTLASNYMAELEFAEPPKYPYGMPFGIAAGNHEQDPQNVAWRLSSETTPPTTSRYNTNFGVNAFLGRSYYGGNFGDQYDGIYTPPNLPTSNYEDNNDNHYDLFSASGIDFVVIYLEYNQNPSGTGDNQKIRYCLTNSLIWADSILKKYPKRHGIIVSHSIIGCNQSFTAGGGGTGTGGSGSGGIIYTNLMTNANLTLLLCGHTGPRARIEKPTVGGKTTWIIMADYQNQAKGGNGYFRFLRFSPSQNKLFVSTMSPYQLNVKMGDELGFPVYCTSPGDSFEIDYDLRGAPYEQIGLPEDVSAPNTEVTRTWSNLRYTTWYEWYVATANQATPDVATANPSKKFQTIKSYTIVDLGTLGGRSWGTAINNSGRIVGYSELPSSATQHAFRIEGNPPINPSTDDLGAALGGIDSISYGINDAGWAVGWADINYGSHAHAFVVPPGRAMNAADDLTPNILYWSSAAHGLNNAGHIVGWYTTADLKQHAFRTAPYTDVNASTDDLGTLGGHGSWAYDINDVGINGIGQIVGQATAANGENHAFRTQPGLTIPQSANADLGTLGGKHSIAYAINDAGQVVGYSSHNPGTYSPYRAFRLAANEVITAASDLGTLGGAFSAARDINEPVPGNPFGDTVGSAHDGAGASRAFILKGATGSVMEDLNDHLPFMTFEESWDALWTAQAINNQGKIVGYGSKHGQTRAFRLDPPTP